MSFNPLLGDYSEVFSKYFTTFAFEKYDVPL